MKSGVIYVAVETYRSSKAIVGWTENTNTRYVYDTVDMRVPSIVFVYSVDVETDFRAIADRMRAHDLIKGENELKNAEMCIDIMNDFFKSRLSDNVEQEIDDATRILMNAILRDDSTAFSTH
jgi:hypothetical protein